MIDAYNLPFGSYLSEKKRKRYSKETDANPSFLPVVRGLTIRAKQTDRIPLPEPTSRALAPSYSWSCRSSRA